MSEDLSSEAGHDCKDPHGCEHLIFNLEREVDGLRSTLAAAAVPLEALLGGTMRAEIRSAVSAIRTTLGIPESDPLMPPADGVPPAQGEATDAK